MLHGGGGGGGGVHLFVPSSSCGFVLVSIFVSLLIVCFSGVGNSPYEKLPALQRCHLSVFSECCFLELLARLSSIRTLLLSAFVVVLLSILYDCSSQTGFCRAPFRFDRFILGLFFGLLEPSYCCYLVVLLRLAFHRAPFILNASFWVFLIHFYPHPSSSSCGFGLFSVS